MTVQSVLDGPAEAAVRRNGCIAPGSAKARACPECGERFLPVQWTQLFCGAAHKRAYNNRWAQRGAVLAPIYAAARVTRNGTRGDRDTGRKASADAHTLVQRWKDEDAAAGRMPAIHYVALRYRLGLVDVVR